MITLAFEDVHCPRTVEDLSPFPRQWSDVIQLGAFEGRQIFLINGCDFTTNYPILGFARALAAICFRLERGSVSEEYIAPHLQPEFYLAFHRRDGVVKVETFTFKHIEDPTLDRSDQRSALVPLQELKDSANKYLDAVITFCSKSIPEIAQDPGIQTWLTDFSIPDFQGLLGTDEQAEITILEDNQTF